MHDIKYLETYNNEKLVQYKLPNMNEFSPGVLEDNNIKHLIAFLLPFNGDKEKMKEAIIANYPKIAYTPSAKQRLNRANNVLIGMSQCGLIIKEVSDIPGNLSELAKEILECPSDAEANNRFALHLLNNCYGLELFDVVEVINDRGEEVTLQAIREELRARGFSITENEGNASKIRQWLESTGIVNDHWNVNNKALHVLTGITTSTLSMWKGLSRGQRIFLTQIKKLDPTGSGNWITVRQIKDLCEQEYSRSVFPEGHLRNNIIYPLHTSGWIEARGKGDGRGGDSGAVRALDLLKNVKIPLVIEGISAIPADLRDKLSKPLSEIFEEINSRDTYIKGIALELLTLRIIQDIGLFPVFFRERSAKTQGAEVDVVANGIHLHYSRWLIQCKNTATVHVNDIAKEVGMAVVLKAHVIVLITTGRFSSTVYKYVDGLSTTSTLQAILIDGTLLKVYKAAGPSAVIDYLKNSAYRVLKLKEPQVSDYEN